MFVYGPSVLFSLESSQTVGQTETLDSRVVCVRTEYAAARVDVGEPVVPRAGVSRGVLNPRWGGARCPVFRVRGFHFTTHQHDHAQHHVFRPSPVRPWRRDTLARWRGAGRQTRRLGEAGTQPANTAPRSLSHTKRF